MFELLTARKLCFRARRTPHFVQRESSKRKSTKKKLASPIFERWRFFWSYTGGVMENGRGGSLIFCLAIFYKEDVKRGIYFPLFSYFFVYIIIDLCSKNFFRS